MKIDAHHHFWKYNPQQHDWIDESMAAIRKDFLPENILPQLTTNQIDKTVLVQVDQTLSENDFMLSCAESHDFIGGVVGWLDLSDAMVEKTMEHYAAQAVFKGVRHILQGEKQRDFMLNASFKNGISLLAKYNLTYDILIYTDQLPFTYDFAKAFPNQSFVIDHMAKPKIASGEMEFWAGWMKKIAELPNVYCKISGLVTEADWKTWTYEQLKPYLESVTEHFGVHRLMFGSDWPVCLVAAEYAEVVQSVENFTQSFSTAEREQIWGANTAKFYNITAF